jgi:UDP-N-acetylmuramate dehydrogenase
MSELTDLPPLRGHLRTNVPLAPLTWMRVGGPAAVIANPADQADLTEFLRALDWNFPVVPIGVASNLLVRDGGLPAVVIRLSGELARVQVESTTVIAGAGALDTRVAQEAAKAGLSGLEFMIGIPGTVGGAVRMNAGAFGGETGERVLWVDIVDREGSTHRLSPPELAFGYRHSSLPEGAIVLRAAFACTEAEPASVLQRMEEIKSERGLAQPLGVATGGSTFKNPPGKKAWQLIDRAGCRGLRFGNAVVSDKHCNFLVNTGKATAAELEALGEEVRGRVFVTSGIKLEWEIVRLGEAAPVELAA